jgi:Helix-turn-helix domain
MTIAPPKFAYQYADIESMRKAILERIAAGKLHREALNVFCFLTDSCLHKASGECFPGYKAIASAIGLSYKTVCKIMTDLIAWGVLVRTRVGFSNRFKTAFHRPESWSEPAARSTPSEGNRSTPPESTRSTPPEGSPINNGILNTGFEQREVTSSRPSDNSDLSDPHMTEPYYSAGLSHDEAVGWVNEFCSAGIRIPTRIRFQVIDRLMNGQLNEEGASEFCMAHAMEKANG